MHLLIKFESFYTINLTGFLSIKSNSAMFPTTVHGFGHIGPKDNIVRSELQLGKLSKSMIN